MRYLIISDIHGSAAALKAALAYFRLHRCDKLLILGDILYHGPRNAIPEGYAPLEVADMLNAMREQIVAVRGNCEAEVDQMVLQFDCSADYQVVHDLGHAFFLTHGHLYSPSSHPLRTTKDIFMSGHTHLYELRKDEQGLIIVNPGSITLPKGGNAATFALLTPEEITIRTVDEDQVVAQLQIG